MSRPSHLNQLFAYLAAEQASRCEEPGVSVEGVLLYGQPAGEEVDLRLTLRNFPVRVLTLDLDRSWEPIELDLRSLVLRPQ